MSPQHPAPRLRSAIRPASPRAAVALATHPGSGPPSHAPPTESPDNRKCNLNVPAGWASVSVRKASRVLRERPSRAHAEPHGPRSGEGQPALQQHSGLGAPTPSAARVSAPLLSLLSPWG